MIKSTLRLTILLLHLCTARLFGAEIVRTIVTPGADRPAAAESGIQVEETSVVFESEEGPLAASIAKQAIASAQHSNASVPVDVFCLTGGEMSAGDCARLRKELEKFEGENYAFNQAKNPAEEAGPAGGKPSNRSRGVLTLLRTVVSGVTVGLTVSVSMGANWQTAITMGTIGGLYPGWLQWHNDTYLDWLAGNRWFWWKKPSTPEERAGFIHGFAKRAATTAAYALMLNFGFQMMGVGPDVMTPESLGSMALMVGSNVYSTAAWQQLNHEMTEYAVARRSGREPLYRFYSGVGSLALSIVSTVGNVLDLAGGPYGTILAGVVGTAGIGAYGVWRIVPKVRAAVELFPDVCRVLYSRLRGQWRRKDP
jgi:hypothetical protein